MGASRRGAVFPTLAALLLCGLAVVAHPAQAQVPAGLLDRAPASRAGTLPSLPPSVSRTSVLSAERLTLEGPLDANEYIVGPGDVFMVAIGGAVPRQLPATVSADGRLVIPEAGSFYVAGQSLARARAQVQNALQQRYRNVTADVSLSAPRTFYVHISGSIPQPGRHLVPAVARVEDAIVEASGTDLARLLRYTTPVVREQEPRWPALRNVSVVDRSGRARTVDLMRYFATGDLASNPYLNDGDALYVPAFDPLAEGVVVGGAVDRPGTYDARPGDTVLDLLLVTVGADPAARVGRVRRVRPVGDGSETRDVSIAEAASLDVQARDQVFAIARAPDADRVEVSGAFRFPGTYPITSGVTTLDAVVAMAGGLRDDALARGLSLERPVRSLRPAAPEAPNPLVTPITAEAAETVRAAEVQIGGDVVDGLFARQFYTRQSERTPRVSIDTEAALRGSAPVALRGGDQITVPFDDGLVRVFGRVARGGYVPFVPGATAAAYVERAGGAGALADGIYVVDASTGELVLDADRTVLPGDAVFVNSLPSADTPQYAQVALQQRQYDRDTALDRRQSRYQFIGTLLTVVGTAVSIVIAYVAVTQRPETMSTSP